MNLCNAANMRLIVRRLGDMRAKAEVDAGICGFKADISAVCEDGQFVMLSISSDCEKMAALGRTLAGKGPIDAYQEISPAAESVILSTARSAVKGCCSACATPVAAFKTMQVAAGLALPGDVHIRISKE